MPETFVVDCSVAAKWVLPEPDRAAALRLLERFESGEVSLIAPDLIHVEFASLLAKRHRRKQISQEQAREAFHLLAQCPVRLFATPQQLPGALDLSLQHQLSLWDCVYLGLALERDCAFLTAAQRLFRGGTGRHPSLRLLR